MNDFNADGERTHTHVALTQGTMISHYQIIEKIGAGGMGEVYLAEDTNLKRQVALKFLPPHLCQDEDCRARFKREAQAAAKLNHPNIVTIYEVSEYQGRSCIVMQYVEGKSLKDIIKEKELPVDQIIDLAIQICEGLSKAHEEGVIHRDIKPSNILISSDGRPKLLDFGLAAIKGYTHITRTGSTLGTVGYMSPEQAEGKSVDERSDLFSLGIILYEMISGRPPFRGDTEGAVLKSILNDTREPLVRYKADVPDELQRIVDEALDKDLETRYQTASGLVADLKRLKKASEVPSAPPPMEKPRWSKIKRLLITSSAVAAVILLLLIFKPWEIGVQPTQEAVSSIAVLPLENRMGDPEQDYFVDGMHEALITNLSKIGALRVISRISAIRIKGTDKSLPEIARELGVDAVVEGSVLLFENRVRVTAQLIAAEPEGLLWAESYERDLRDILALQSEVARAIAREIKIAVTPAEETRLAAAREVNPEAYEAYLKGMFHLNKFTPEGREKGLEYLNQAIEKDPADPLAYAGLALGYASIGHSIAPTPDAWPRAREAALRALMLDEALAEGHAALADVKLYYEWDWEGAEKAFLRANELNPNLATNHFHYAWYHALFGRLDEAIVEHKRAQELDPLMRLYTIELGVLYWIGGDYEKAIVEIQKALELNPNSKHGLFFLGQVLADAGMYEEAIAVHQKAVAISPNVKLKWALGHTYALAGRWDEAREILVELEEEEATSMGAYGLAALYAALGEKDDAFRWLAYEQPHAWVPWIRVLPLFEPLWDDPRFKDLLQRMNLPER
jgi:serine/threonine protein kinase/tetratricopeptide (TPR) repeat protein